MSIENVMANNIVVTYLFKFFDQKDIKIAKFKHFV